MKNKNDENVSVIIRTKNEEQFIGHVVQSVVDNLKKPEIIIIDNFSEDATLDIIKLFGVVHRLFLRLKSVVNM